jgi:hypothetical protein
VILIVAFNYNLEGNGMAVEQIQMTAEQIYNLWDTGLKIGIGALCGGVATWFSARHAFKMQILEHKFEKDKVKYDRVNDLVFEIVKITNELESSLNTLAKKKTRIIHKDEILKSLEEGADKLEELERLNELSESMREYNLISSEYSTSESHATALTILLSDRECIASITSFINESQKFFLSVSNADSIEDMGNLEYGDLRVAKTNLHFKLSLLLNDIYQ